MFSMLKPLLTIGNLAIGELIWKARAPARVRFMWLAVKGWCLTADILLKRGWPHEPVYSLCQSDLEDCNHLFTACAYTNRVWTLLQDWINVDFHPPGRHGLPLAEWWHKREVVFRVRYRNAFDSLFLMVRWFIWKE